MKTFGYIPKTQKPAATPQEKPAEKTQESAGAKSQEKPKTGGKK